MNRINETITVLKMFKLSQLLFMKLTVFSRIDGHWQEKNAREINTPSWTTGNSIVPIVQLIKINCQYTEHGLVNTRLVIPHSLFIYIIFTK